MSGPMHRASNTPRTGIATRTTEIGQTYVAFDQLPARVRQRLATATLPIDPISLLAYYRQGIDGGFDPAYVESVVIKAIDDTERLAATTLDRERSTWNIGEEMAASMKAANARRLGR